MMKENKPMSDKHNDVPLHAHKIDNPQTDSMDHGPDAATMGVKTGRPQVTGSIKLVDYQLVYQRRIRNVSTNNQENFGSKFIKREESNTPW